MRFGERLRHQVPRIVAIVVIGGLYLMAQLPEASPPERASLADRFRFARQPLTELSRLPEDVRQPVRDVRTVHPSLQRISAWISAVGAGVALADLDGDGLPNDVCHVDPRIDQAIVAPVPGTPERYAPFVLRPRSLSHDPTTTAPMGCLPGDWNEDGETDLLVYYWGRTPLAFLRQGGDRLGAESYVAREVVSGAQGERWYTNAATRADLDGDGHLDLVVGNYFPDGARILDAEAGGIERMQDSMSRAFNGGDNRILLWEGASGTDVRFKEFSLGDIPGVTERVSRGWTLAVGARDLDGDLHPEIYFANDFGPDRLLHNRSEPGRLRFALLQRRKSLTTPGSKSLGHDSFKGMSVAFGDLNRDGWSDIYVSNIADEFALEESHFAWVSTGNVGRMRQGVAPYLDRSEPLGLSRSGWGWGTRLADFDNSGRLEAVQATGFIKGRVDRWPELHELAMGNDELIHDPRSWPRFQPGTELSGYEHNPFYVRAEDGRFVDIARDLGIDAPQVSRGLATADVDGDGDVDLAVANQWEPSHFYRNDCPNCGAFLGVHLLLPLEATPTAVDTHPGHPDPTAYPMDRRRGRPAVGAKAVVHYPDGETRAVYVDGGSGHSGVKSPNLHVGLGDLPPTASVEVDLSWRGLDGEVRSTSLKLEPGWHTVWLGGPPEQGTVAP